MNINALREIIATIGFPASCVIALAWYIQKRDKQQIEDRKEERQLLLNEIEFSRKVSESLLITNKTLSSDIKVELQDIKTELQQIAKGE